jgi:hypothetical protein
MDKMELRSWLQAGEKTRIVYNFTIGRIACERDEDSTKELHVSPPSRA